VARLLQPGGTADPDWAIINSTKRNDEIKLNNKPTWVDGDRQTKMLFRMVELLHVGINHSHSIPSVVMAFVGVKSKTVHAQGLFKVA